MGASLEVVSLRLMPSDLLRKRFGKSKENGSIWLFSASVSAMSKTPDIPSSPSGSAEGATCEICGYTFVTDEEAEACEDGHIMAEEEMGIFDGDGSSA